MSILNIWRHSTFSYLNATSLLQMQHILSKLPSHNQYKHKENKEMPFSEAAVLIPLCHINNMESVLFTIRSNKLRSHTGEVSFPGGMRDHTDVSLIDTALRETKEEVDIDVNKIKVIGQLPPVLNLKRSILVTPIVGYLGHIHLKDIQCNVLEVDSVFALSFLEILDKNHIIWGHFQSSGLRIPTFTAGPVQILGLTAFMLYNFISQVMHPLVGQILIHEGDVIE